MIEPDELQKVAQLARLKMTSEELEALGVAVGSTLEYVSMLEDGEEAHAKGPIFGLVDTVVREDGDPHPAREYSEKLLSHATNREGNFIAVKKMFPQ